MKTGRSTLLAALSMSVAAISLHSQTDTGSIPGQVADSWRANDKLTNMGIVTKLESEDIGGVADEGGRLQLSLTLGLPEPNHYSLCLPGAEIACSRQA